MLICWRNQNWHGHISATTSQSLAAMQHRKTCISIFCWTKANTHTADHNVNIASCLITGYNKFRPK